MLLAGCHGTKNNWWNNSALWNLKELEARHYDIPFIFDAQPIAGQSSNASQITFKSNVSLDQAIDFYRQQMDVYGWNLLFCVKDTETLLSFEKPNKYAMVSIRPTKANQLTVIIMLAMKSNS
jgi:hypothetical protein